MLVLPPHGCGLMIKLRRLANDIRLISLRLNTFNGMFVVLHLCAINCFAYLAKNSIIQSYTWG